MKLKGSMTIEASYIFPFITMLAAAIIVLDFMLYDSLLSDAQKILGGIRYHEAETFYYDVETEQTDFYGIVCSPVLSEDKAFLSRQKLLINKSVSESYVDGRLDGRNKLSDTDVEDVITAGDNAAVVRAGGKAVEIIGGQM